MIVLYFLQILWKVYCLIRAWYLSNFYTPPLFVFLCHYLTWNHNYAFHTIYIATYDIIVCSNSIKTYLARGLNIILIYLISSKENYNIGILFRKEITVNWFPHQWAQNKSEWNAIKRDRIKIFLDNWKEVGKVISVI